jgi:hypothetical protein
MFIKELGTNWGLPPYWVHKNTVPTTDTFQKFKKIIFVSETDTHVWMHTGVMKANSSSMFLWWVPNIQPLPLPIFISK